MAGTLYAGASGFSYPSWRPDFYPAGARPADFLELYASRLPAVELNATGRRLPTSDQLRRWADATPPGFRFAVKLTTWVPARPQAAPAFCAAVRALGTRLGPILVQLPDLGRHDPQLVRSLAAELDPELVYAIEPKGEAWNPTDVREAFAELDADLVSSQTTNTSCDYRRLRSPPYGERELGELARSILPRLASGRDVYAFFRHEDEPTAPRYAARLLELVKHPNQQFPHDSCGEPEAPGR